MQEFFLSNHFIALATGGIIFLITVVLASKEIISFALTVLFLLFAIAAAVGIENYDLFRIVEEHRSFASPHAAMEQMLRDNREMKAEMESQSKKLQNLIDATETYIRSERQTSPAPTQ